LKIVLLFQTYRHTFYFSLFLCQSLCNSPSIGTFRYLFLSLTLSLCLFQPLVGVLFFTPHSPACTLSQGIKRMFIMYSSKICLFYNVRKRLRLSYKPIQTILQHQTSDKISSNWVCACVCACNYPLLVSLSVSVSISLWVRHQLFCHGPIKNGEQIDVVTYPWEPFWSHINIIK